MRILFVSPRAWPAVGGAEAFLRHLTTALAARHDVRICALSVGNEPAHRLWESILPPPTFEAFEHDGVRVEPLRLPLPRRALLTPLVAQVVPGLRRYAFGRARFFNMKLYAHAVAPLIAEAADDCDVIHMWGTGLLGAATVQAAQLLGVPCVVTPFAHRGQWGDDRASAATYRAAHRTFALLEADARLYLELGVPSSRIAVCGVCSPGVESGSGAAVRRERGIDGPLVLFLARRDLYKGVDLLLGAAERLPHVTFAVAGPGPAVSAPSGARVLDLGQLDERGRAAWLDAADLLCMPSAAEIFPSSMLEAWSVGTPAVTSDIPPLAELAAATGGSVAVPREADALAATLRELLASPDRVRALGEAGRRAWHERYTPQAVAARYERVYNDVLLDQVQAA